MTCEYCGKTIEPQGRYVETQDGYIDIDCWEFLEEDGENIYEPLF